MTFIATLLIVSILGLLLVRRRWLAYAISRHLVLTGWYIMAKGLPQDSLYHHLTLRLDQNLIILDIVHWDLAHYMENEDSYYDVVEFCDDPANLELTPEIVARMMGTTTETPTGSEISVDTTQNPS